ncbi:MAG TPA: hypothetical protein VJR03_13495 [Nitrospira sp.]|nr:hypothetical protein [Nitrospira sp.]
MTLLLSLLLLLGGLGQSAWAEPAQPTAGSEIKGDVLYWEEDELVVRELSGHQVRLRVTPDTKIQGASGRLKTGDKIIATGTPDGPALSITVQIPDSGPPGR